MVSSHFFLSSMLALLSFYLPATTLAQNNTVSPIAVRGAAHARTATKLYILGGKDKLSAYPQFFSLDLAVPWQGSQAAWGKLPDGIAQDIFPMAASMDEKELVVFHAGQGSSSLLTARLFNLVTQQWSTSQFSAQYAAFQGNGAVTDPSTGLVYIAGSYTDASRGSLNIYTFESDSMKTLTIPPDQLINRGYYTNAWSKRLSSALYFGGYNASLQPVLGPDANVVTRYSPSTGQWSRLQTTGTPPSMRADHCMTTNDDGTKLVIFSGRTYTPLTIEGEIFILDLNTFQWTKGTSGTTRLYTACTIAGNQFIVWGGEDYLGNIMPPDVLIYNLDSGTWGSSYTPPASYLKGNNTTTPPGSGTSSSSLSPGVIAGIAVGGLAVVCAIALFILFRKHRHSRLQNKTSDANSSMKPGNSSPPTSSSQPTAPSPHLSGGSPAFDHGYVQGQSHNPQGQYEAHQKILEQQYQQAQQQPQAYGYHSPHHYSGAEASVPSSVGMSLGDGAPSTYVLSDLGKNTLIQPATSNGQYGYVDSNSHYVGQVLTPYPPPPPLHSKPTDKPVTTSATSTTANAPHALLSKETGIYLDSRTPGNPHTVIGPS